MADTRNEIEQTDRRELSRESSRRTAGGLLELSKEEMRSTTGGAQTVHLKATINDSEITGGNEIVSNVSDPGSVVFAAVAPRA